MVSAFDAVIPAGGTARRLGGTDKAMLVVDGTTLLERVLAAVERARTVVVVGPERPVPVSMVSVVWAREDPPLSGPLAALATGLRHGTAEHVVVAACDLPHFAAPVVDHLLATLDAAPHADGAVLVDAGGRRQPLAAVYRRAALAAALTAIGDPRNRPVRLLADELTLVEVSDPLAAVDIDTPDDLANLHARPTRRATVDIDTPDDLANLHARPTRRATVDIDTPDDLAGLRARTDRPSDGKGS